MSLLLTDNAGTGEMIMQNMEAFSFALTEEREGISLGAEGTPHPATMFEFDWRFFDQAGTAGIIVRKEDGVIAGDSVLRHSSFDRYLSPKRDDTITTLFEYMLEHKEG